MLEFIYSLLAGIQAYIQGIVTGIGAAITSVVQSIGSWVSAAYQQIADTLGNLIQNIGSVIVRIASDVVREIQRLMDPVLDTLAALVSDIREFFANIMNTLREVVIALWERVTRSIQQALDAVGDLVRGVFAEVQALAQAAVDSVWGFVKSVGAQIVSLIDQGLRAIQMVTEAVVARVTQGLGAMLNDARVTIQRTEDLVTEAWRNVVTGSNALIKSIDSRLTDVREGLADVVTGMTEQIGKLTQEQVKALTEGFDSIIGRLEPFLSGAIVGKARETLTYLTEPSTIYTKDRASAHRLMSVYTDEKGLGGVILAITALVILLPRLFYGIMDANAQMVLQEYGHDHPWAVLSPAEAASAYRQQRMTEEEAADEIRRNGHDLANAKVLIHAADQAPTPFELAMMERRGFIARGSVERGLLMNGYAREWWEHLVALTEVIPPISDLIHMAVREAFSPDIAERFGQFEDYPEALNTWIHKMGLSPEWGQRYWAAHWSLPSVQMGFEMLHRKVPTRDGGEFSRADLDMLMRAQDIMPFWREPLLQIAYRPFTRVDIRRMHKVGVLSDDDLARAYTDLGYDDDHADALRRFTIELNRPAKPDSADELGRLTRSSIISFYRSGLIERDRAKVLLTEQGITPEAAEMFIAAADLAEEQETREANATLLRERVLSGEISETQAETSMRGLGYTEAEVAVWLAKIEREQSRKVKLPSRAEAERMLGAQIITEQEYRELLGRLGYSARWSNAFVELARVKTREEV